MPVGTITDFSGLKTRFQLSGIAIGTAQVSGDNPPTVDVSRDFSTAWSKGTGGADKIDQLVSVIFTATKNATSTLDLTGALANVIGDPASTLSKIRAVLFEYLTSSQDSVNGSNVSAAATVSINPSAANPWINSPLGADQIYKMKPGDKWWFETHDAAGRTVTAATGDKMDFVHPDNDYDAKFRITIFGEK